MPFASVANWSSLSAAGMFLESGNRWRQKLRRRFAVRRTLEAISVMQFALLFIMVLLLLAG
jgi:hypothetical protein